MRLTQAEIAEACTLLRGFSLYMADDDVARFLQLARKAAALCEACGRNRDLDTDGLCHRCRGIARRDH